MNEATADAIRSLLDQHRSLTVFEKSVLRSVLPETIDAIEAEGLEDDEKSFLERTPRSQHHSRSYSPLNKSLTVTGRSHYRGLSYAVQRMLDDAISVSSEQIVADQILKGGPCASSIGPTETTVQAACVRAKMQAANEAFDKAKSDREKAASDARHEIDHTPPY